MLLRIPRVLDAAQLQMFREELGKVEWADGRGSAGDLARKVKDNQQLLDDHPVGRKLAKVVLQALRDNQLFTAAALPLKIVPPMFNRYEQAQMYGRHVDGSIRPLKNGLRMLLLELDRAIQKVARETPAQSATTDLAGVYHNLLRLWADA